MNYIKSLVFALLLTCTLGINAQIIHSPKIGIGLTYGAHQGQSLLEFSAAADLSNKISFNLRYANDTNTIFRLGGGVEYAPFKFGRFSPSIGMEIYYNRELFPSFENRMSYVGFQMPLMINYRVSDSFQIDFGLVGRSSRYGNDTNFVRLSTYYIF